MQGIYIVFQEKSQIFNSAVIIEDSWIFVLLCKRQHP